MDILLNITLISMTFSVPLISFENRITNYKKKTFAEYTVLHITTRALYPMPFALHHVYSVTNLTKVTLTLKRSNFQSSFALYPL